MIQVREYASISDKADRQSSIDHGVVSSETLAWLQTFSDKWTDKQSVAIINGYKSVKLDSYVGYLESPSGEGIEILPKTSDSEEDPDKQRKLLIKVLRTVYDLPPREAGVASLSRQNQPIHEWIFTQFLSELTALVKRGLRFDYERIEEENKFIRGQLQLEKQQRNIPGKEHLFNISYDIFTANRIENRLLKTALVYVLNTCKEDENWRLANELHHQMIEIDEVINPLSQMSRWSSGRHMHPYKLIRSWCEIILEKLNPSFQHGCHRGISLLFPMEKLFEKYVEVKLRSRLPKEATLTPQASSQYLVRSHEVEGFEPTIFQLRPDLLLRKGELQQVLDVKWKRLDGSPGGRGINYKISQQDMYQLFAYGQKYQQGQGHIMLIYPKHQNFEKQLPPFYFEGEESKGMTLWVVPFCLDTDQLIPGNWKEKFFIN